MMLTGFLSPYLIGKRVKAAQPYLEGKKRILDIGCGVFIWHNLLPLAADYIGIDCDETVIEYNQDYFSHKFFKIDVETDDIGCLGDGFDLIIMLAVIEHLNEPEIVLKKIVSLLEPNGIIVITTPHPVGNFILNLGANLGVFARDKYQHHNMMDYKRIRALAYNSKYNINKYKRFLCGFNQLIVLGKMSDVRSF